MSMAIIGVAGTVIGAGASIYGTMSQQKAAKAAAGANANGLNLGQKPKAAEYKPVNFGKEQLKTVWANQDALNNIIPLMSRTNASIDADALKRATKLIPNYSENMKLEGQASNSLLQGQLPYDDVLDIVSKRGELGNAMGTPGGSAPATMRDLGISRLSAIQSGAGLMRGMVDMAETISPISRHALPQSMFLNPETAIRNRMEQNQLIQQSDQNVNNLEAGVSPTDAANAQMALASRAAGGSASSNGAAAGGYASAIQQLIGGLGKAYAGSGSTGTPNYGNPSGTVPNFSTWKTGPQNGTYYQPSTSIRV